MEAVKEPLMLMEIERELAGPQKEAALARYDAVLSALAARIDAAMGAWKDRDGREHVQSADVK